jgi:hypothetical protein
MIRSSPNVMPGQADAYPQEVRNGKPIQPRAVARAAITSAHTIA